MTRSQGQLKCFCAQDQPAGQSTSSYWKDLPKKIRRSQPVLHDSAIEEHLERESFTQFKKRVKNTIVRFPVAKINN